MQNNIQAQLEALNNSWLALNIVPEDLGSIIVEGFTRQNISDAFASMSIITQAINEDDSFEPDLLSLGALQNKINVVKKYIASNLPSNPEAHLPAFVGHVETLRSGLLEWAALADTKKQKISKSLIHRLGETNIKAAEVAAIHSEAVKLKEELLAASQEVTGIFHTASEGAEVFEASLNEATTKSREVNRLEEQSKFDAEVIRKLVEGFADFKEEIENARKEQNILFAEFESYRDSIDQTLGDSNRVSMAGAFITRRDTYDAPLELWNRVFVLCLVVLILMAVWVISPFLTSGNWRDVLIRLPLSAPAIWLAWFASKQYGYITRLREDYAYKAAAAMAFEGYKREAKEAGDGMEIKLLETAISHLGDNPIRVYETKEKDLNTPWEEFLDNQFKDKRFTTSLVELIKAIKA